MWLKLVLNIFVIIAIGYEIYKFTQLLFEMRKEPVLPATKEEVLNIRKDPQKVVAFPTYSNHKSGIILYYLVLLFLIVMYIVGIITEGVNWSYYLLLLISIGNLHNFLNMFAIMDEGILTGSRFIAWKKIKSFQLVSIDKNHKFFGYSKEVNHNSYELILKQKVFTTSCIVTSKEIKEKIIEILNKHIQQSADGYKIEIDK